jgi:hypothetical protein
MIVILCLGNSLAIVARLDHYRIYYLPLALVDELWGVRNIPFKELFYLSWTSKKRSCSSHVFPRHQSLGVVLCCELLNFHDS